MDNSAYIALSRQMAVFRDLDITANNIANVNTTGFQAERIIFDDHLVDADIHAEDRLAFARDPISFRNTSGGRFTKTGNNFDLAISGPGYFSVDTPQGVRYTRAGNFSLNPEGLLVNANGHPVLGGDGANIVIPRTARNIIIGGDGHITADGEPSGQIGLFEFETPQAMTRVGNSLLETEEPPLAPADTRVSQGHLEASNVNAVTELTHLLQLQHSVGSTAKFIETIYDLERKTSETYTRQIAN